jgi:Trk-type K+ transport system membrane component
MIRFHKKYKNWTAIGIALVILGGYMYPLGMMELFEWFMHNWFEGDYARTTQFFYVWTTIAILLGIMFITSTTNTKPGRVLRKYVF